jgi:hypothetical protein
MIMAKKSLKQKDIVDMLSELRNETPEYPPELMRSRKTTFIKRVVDLKISGTSQDGKGGYKGGDDGPKWGGGVTWEELSGGAAATGSSTKTMIAIGIVVALLTAAFLFRNQIVELLVENEIINVAETAAPSIASTPTERATATPTPTAPLFGAPPSGTEATKAAPGSGNNDSGGAPGGGNGSGGVSGGSNNSDDTEATPTPGVIRNLGTPTPPPPDGIVGRLRFLVCVLRYGAADCE